MLPPPPTTALSLYIHFPFCRSRCRYCDFFSTASREAEAGRYIDALERECAMVVERYGLQSARLATVYCGGGTPSLLSARQWRVLAESVVGRLPSAADLEWSIECNPDSFAEDKAEAWLDTGVTRLTVGVQSMHDRCLRLLGRPHTARQTADLLANPVLRRFGSVGADIMYGLPGQDTAALERSVEAVLAAGSVSHLSAYELTIAAGTPFGRHRSLLPLPTEKRVVAMYRAVQRLAGLHGFAQYEISNYARPGHRCRHNMRYWTHEPYVGLGPSAHSYLLAERRANVADLQSYFHEIEAGRLPTARAELLGADELGREAILLGLRTVEGIDERRYRRLTGDELASGRRRRVLQRLSSEGYLVHREEAWRPTRKGLLVADALARELA